MGRVASWLLYLAGDLLWRAFDRPVLHRLPVRDLYQALMRWSVTAQGEALGPWRSPEGA